MANMAQMGNALETGNGVFKGDPLFIMADGQVVDFDGKEVAPAARRKSTPKTKRGATECLLRPASSTQTELTSTCTAPALS